MNDILFCLPQNKLEDTTPIKYRDHTYSQKRHFYYNFFIQRFYISSLFWYFQNLLVRNFESHVDVCKCILL